MSDFKLPDLPSDEELGLSKEEIEELEKEFGDDGPEMTPEEMAALFGEEPPRPSAPPPAKAPAAAGGAKAAAAKGGGGTGTPDPTAAKAAAKKAEKEAKAAAKRAEKEAKAAAKKAEKERKAAERKTAKEKKASGAGADGAAPPPPDGGQADAGPAKTERPRPAEAARTKWQGPAMLVAMAALLIGLSSRTGLPTPGPANAPEDDFSSARAMTTLVDIASEAHPPGSPEHARVRDYLVEQLEDLGLEPEIQTTTAIRSFGETAARAATVRNIVARLPGAESTGAVLVTAHYDGREHAKGAGDDGSGVVTILETVRALQAGPPLQNDLIVLLTDAEELGLLGAQAFVDEHPWMDDVRLVLSFEMRGGGGPSIMFETGSQNGWVVRAFQAADPVPFANSLSYAVYERMPNDTDFTPFKEAGVQGLNFAAVDRARVYHQQYDSPENLSESTLQHHGLHALNVIRYLGDQDLEASLVAPDVVYFTLPFLGLVVYESRWVVPISLGLVAVLVLGFLSARMAGATGSGMLVGLGVSIVGGTLSYGAALFLMPQIAPLHPEYGSLHGGAFHSEGWYVLALLGVVLTIVTALHSVARRWLGAADLAFGATAIPVAGALAIGFVEPIAAMNLQIPVGAALLSIVLMGLLRGKASGPAGWVVSLVLMAATLPLLVFVVEALWILMSLRLAAPLAAAMAIGAYLCLPALDQLRHPNSWWAPVTTLVLAAGFLGVGWMHSDAAPDRPAPTTLAYALDHASGDAWWVTDPLEDSVDAPARAWAVDRAGDAFDTELDLSAFGYLNGETPVTRARAVDVPPPTIFVENDTTVRGVRRTFLSVRSGVGAERFIFRAGGDTRIVSVNQVPLEANSDIQWVDHWGEPEPAVVLGLETPSGQALQLVVVEHLLRPWELLGDEAWDRPPEFAPDITRLSDRAMLRYTVDESRLQEGTLLERTSGPGAPSFSAPTRTPAAGAAAADTTSVSRSDTAAAAPADTLAAAPDTSAVTPDTSAMAPDTSGVARGPSGAASDTLGAASDTSDVAPDPSGATPDTSSATPDTSTAEGRTREG